MYFKKSLVFDSTIPKAVEQQNYRKSGTFSHHNFIYSRPSFQGNRKIKTKALENHRNLDDENNTDNRSKEKRVKMKAYRKTPQRNNSSSSGQKENGRLRGVIDVADSSDERGVGRNAWVSSTVPSQSRQYSLTDIELDEAEQDAQMMAGDFNLMSQLPSSAGANFQFSSEKNWDTPEGEQLLQNIEASEYFTLNLKLLNVGIQTVPFYKRMDYQSSKFTAEQRLLMDKAAEVAEKKYQNLLQELEFNRLIKTNDSQKTSFVQPKVLPKTPNEPDELDKLLSLTTTKMENVVGETVTAVDVPVTAPIADSAENPGSSSVAENNKDDIQHWLENVLQE